MSKQRLQFDEIGRWSEIKLEIVRRYAIEYSRILARQPRLTHFYIDGFAGMGAHKSKTTGEIVPGSPINALRVEPRFKRYYFIDLEGDCVDSLAGLIGDDPAVRLRKGDCNRLLLSDVFPDIQWKQRRRALCLLDPFGLHLEWTVVEAAGRLKTIDLFLNFPVMDMNRNAFWHDPAGVDPADIRRMTAFWGDESWREAAYRESPQEELFGGRSLEKQSNETIVNAYRDRLQRIAGFRHVASPLPMKNSRGFTIYYLLFASQKAVANQIASYILKKFGEH